MKLSLFLFLVASSCIFAASWLGAITRPHYGGTLRIELQAQVASFDPFELGSSESALSTKLQNLLYDRLARLDANGQPQPALALSWERDAQSAKWRLKLRPGVKWH